MTGSQKSTVISFNKGANWSPVTAPTLDSDMLPVECYYVSVIIYIHENIYDNDTIICILSPLTHKIFLRFTYENSCL